jgi:hypothetical protein
MTSLLCSIDPGQQKVQLFPMITQAFVEGINEDQHSYLCHCLVENCMQSIHQILLVPDIVVQITFLLTLMIDRRYKGGEIPISDKMWDKTVRSNSLKSLSRGSPCSKRRIS